MDGRAFGPKVAIPKLGGRSSWARTRQNKPPPRVQRACENCNKRKTRCSGERPRCQNCVLQQLQCVYPQGRKDRLKEVTEQNSQLVSLLKDLNLHTDEYGQKRIDEVLSSFGDHQLAPSVVSSLEERADDSNLGKSYNETDPLDEDLFRSRHARATGFVGRNSEVQWLRTLKMQMESSVKPELVGDTAVGPSSGRGLHVSDSTYYLDSDDLEVDLVVDLYELPTVEEADRLFRYYMQTIHSSFPIVPQDFELQFRRYMESVRQGRRYQVPDSWQAMLNLIFAIGSQYAQLIHAEPRTGEKSHIIYMTRATQLLGLNDLITALSAPTISIIQATALLSLYYLTIGQISRAWMMIGISLRFALAVGLHLRNDDPSVPKAKKDGQVRTWWSIQSIESLICALIGRPCTIPNDECTVPLPIGLSEDQSSTGTSLEGTSPILQETQGHSLPNAPHDSSGRGNSAEAIRASYFGARIVISLSMQKALSKLYLPRASVDRWDQIQKEIIFLSKELDAWVSEAFPSGLSLANSIQESSGQREQLLLSFQYHGARLLIYRPCLCRLDQRIEGQSDVSAQFNQDSAEACVEAAHAIARLFPEEPTLAFIYQKSPWWCIVHNIMQAIAVFLLDMFYGQIHVAEPSETVLDSLRKLIRWLRFMSTSSIVASRAYELVSDMVKTITERLGVNISEVLMGESVVASPRRPSTQPVQTAVTTQSVPTQGYNLPAVDWATPPMNHSFPGAQIGQRHSDHALPSQAAEVPPEQLQPVPSFALDPALQMPPVFGNPFHNNFDFANPLDEAPSQPGWFNG